MGGGPRRRARHEGGGLLEQRHERSWLPGRGRLALPRTVHQRGRPGHRGPRDEGERLEAQPGPGPRRRAHARRPRGGAPPRRPAHLRPGLGLGFHAVPPARWDRLAQPRLRRRRRRRRVPLHLRRLQVVHDVRRYVVRVRPRPRPDGRHRRDAARRCRALALRVRRLRGDRRGLRARAPEALEGQAGRGQGEEPPDRRGRLHRHGRSPRPARAAREGRGPAVPQLRPARERPRRAFRRRGPL